MPAADRLVIDEVEAMVERRQVADARALGLGEVAFVDERQALPHGNADQGARADRVVQLGDGSEPHVLSEDADLHRKVTLLGRQRQGRQQ